MQRSILLIAAAATLLLTGFILYRVACPHTHASHHNSRAMRDPLASGAGLNFRQSQPTHWRDVMMQR
jgi:hypothetical protein